MTTKKCNRCYRVLHVDEFYFVSKKLGTRRGACKRCVAEIKAIQRDPAWLPSCTRCDVQLNERAGPGRRLCDDCYAATYSVDEKRDNGSRRLLLKPCSLCGGQKERFERGKLCSRCKPWESYAKSLRRFGLTPTDYEALFAAQGGACAICKKTKFKQRLAIDHDHSLGETRQAVRGLLCRHCNYQRLPLFQESVDLLRSAIAYLEGPPAHAVLLE